MSSRIDIEAGVAAINKNLMDHGFRPKADSDFQYGDDPSLRFKTGTVHGEVTVTVWKHARRVGVIRILSDAQVIEAKHQIDQMIHAFFNGRAVNHEETA